ncbi:hypothetical protein ACB098_12G114300 [Castanea mollissima]
MCKGSKTQIFPTLEWIEVLQLKKEKSLKAHPPKSFTVQVLPPDHAKRRRSRIFYREMVALKPTPLSPPHPQAQQSEPPRARTAHSSHQTRYKHSHPIAPQGPKPPPQTTTNRSQLTSAHNKFSDPIN